MADILKIQPSARLTEALTAFGRATVCVVEHPLNAYTPQEPRAATGQPPDLTARFGDHRQLPMVV